MQEVHMENWLVYFCSPQCCNKQRSATMTHANQPRVDSSKGCRLALQRPISERSKTLTFSQTMTHNKMSNHKTEQSRRALVLLIRTLLTLWAARDFILDLVFWICLGWWPASSLASRLTVSSDGAGAGATQTLRSHLGRSPNAFMDQIRPK